MEHDRLVCRGNACFLHCPNACGATWPTCMFNTLLCASPLARSRSSTPSCALLVAFLHVCMYTHYVRRCHMDTRTLAYTETGALVDVPAPSSCSHTSHHLRSAEVVVLCALGHDQRLAQHAQSSTCHHACIILPTHAPWLHTLVPWLRRDGGSKLTSPHCKPQRLRRRARNATDPLSSPEPATAHG